MWKNTTVNCSWTNPKAKKSNGKWSNNLRKTLSWGENTRQPVCATERIAMTYYVYVLASATNYSVYIGVTNDLIRRVYEQRMHADPHSFTSQYNVHKLVYFEETSDIKAALEREKQLKGWRRSKKNTLIEMKNPQWRDLYPDLLG